MLCSKTKCSQCEHYRSCPLETRLFINYCGSRKEKVESSISAAIADCSSRRTFVIKHRMRPGLLGMPHPARIQV
jgi:hypothetical protein